MSKKTKINYYKTLKPFIDEFALAGIKLRIERGDFRSDACWVNGELQVFINRRLNIKDQKKLIEDLKMRDDIKDRFKNVAGKEIVS